jgi:PAS domain-containing protein
VIRTGESQAAQGVPVTLPSRRGRPARELVIDYVIQPIVENGHTLGVFISGNDVTARHLAERQLRESDGALPPDRRFGAGADVGEQPRSHPQLRQPRLCRIVGLDYEGRQLDWRTILHPDDHDRSSRSIAGEASRSRSRWRRAIARPGEWRWIRSTSSPLRRRRHQQGFIGVAPRRHRRQGGRGGAAGTDETLERRVEERTADLQRARRLQQEVAERERPRKRCARRRRWRRSASSPAASRTTSTIC